MDLELRFGGDTAGTEASTTAIFKLPNPVLDGAPGERLDAGLVRSAGHPTDLWERAGIRWGMAFADVSDGDFAAGGTHTYRQLLNASRGLHLHRIWNFVPRINGRADGLENYRAFCVGRGAALDEAYGAGAERRLPAATGVGTGGERLAVVFVAGARQPRHLENPAQTPAYRYPERYGPRAPSFARGTLVEGEPTRLYVSGTGAIRDSESLHPGDVASQCRVVLENIDLVARSGGLPGLRRDTPGRRWFRVYLRHADDWPRVSPLLDAGLLRPGDTLQVLQADICRSELLMEIEARVDLEATPQDACQ